MAERDPAAELVVLDRLEVGPARIEARRLRAPYRVVRGGVEEATELAFTWEEDVFDPEDPVDGNLAALIAAQPALNYGLFCEEIVLHGPWGEPDRGFLEEALENTAREIWVKKLLEPNPFLRAPLDLPAGPRERFARARLDLAGEGGLGDSRPWTASPEPCAVLSSGGKDSLLSHGVLDEIGLEVHPIFCNESGRHWWTALRAHRWFAANVPRTTRVWMSSDRLFNWMLRRLPFIREDFQEIRADIYPIRLWTVAVFLFAALPLLRRRGIGRLVVGDEHDTSVLLDRDGIPHYDGLYDQSIWFDRSLTAYFEAKGWRVEQFSILRPLSEMLIEKTLAERYPDLLALQVSCHAAHKVDDTIVPCGRCEKCRRIVGMLTAIGVDPARCGYEPDAADRCLAKLESAGVHQEEAGARQLLWMLRRAGALPGEAVPGEGPHPEILHLRYDPEASPFEELPAEIREPVTRIFLEHTAGALRRAAEGGWQPWDPLEDAADLPAAGSGEDRGPRPWIWGELTSPDLKDRTGEVDLALLPVGALEQHGPHLPLDTDAFDADWLVRQVAERCSQPRPLVLPCLPYGVSYHHDDFAGTISLRNATLAALVHDIGISLHRNGIRKLVIVNGHGGNDPTLQYAAQTINRETRMFVCVDTGETSDEEIYRLAETQEDIHAGEIETSTTLALRPGLVRMERGERDIPRFASRYLHPASREGVSWHAHTRRLSDTGIMGDPTKASAEKGRAMWELMIRHLVALVEDIKGLSLDEIYERRY